MGPRFTVRPSVVVNDKSVRSRVGGLASSSLLEPTETLCARYQMTSVKSACVASVDACTVGWRGFGRPDGSRYLPLYPDERFWRHRPTMPISLFIDAELTAHVLTMASQPYCEAGCSLRMRVVKVALRRPSGQLLCGGLTMRTFTPIHSYDGLASSHIGSCCHFWSPASVVMAPVRWAKTVTMAMRSPRPAPTGKSPARCVISSVRAGSASRAIVAMDALIHPTASSATMAIRLKTRALTATQAASSAAVAVRRLQARRASAAMDGLTRSKASNAIMGLRTARPVHQAIPAVSHAAAAVHETVDTCGDGVVIRKTVKPATMATAPPRPAPTVSRAAPSAMPPVRASPATQRCGDGVRQSAFEQCDDGNTVTESCAYGDNDCTICDASCNTVNGVERYCGDGVVEPAEGEACDDGNTITEACDYGESSCTVCSSTCENVAGATRSCGDGVVDAGFEQCDDGNNIDTDACPNSCRFTNCGDGVLQAGEACDDGNNTTESCAYGETSCTVCNANCQNGQVPPAIVVTDRPIPAVARPATTAMRWIPMHAPIPARCGLWGWYCADWP